jgi:hypothetical protein
MKINKTKYTLVMTRKRQGTRTDYLYRSINNHSVYVLVTVYHQKKWTTKYRGVWFYANKHTNSAKTYAPITSKSRILQSYNLDLTATKRAA